ncbi:hypothetical protein H5397_12410 [Propioniciclava sp. MC1683]|jgi:hypothetical protein|uniref:hypothetical protein n=1 Tax=Propioniciclava sp. MC1683 TaxID=2760309 RepID=UPI001602AC63|nr:hypothetical protein [Propioniciclava sp. MC1683]MBB1502217.1 hypothetical protein [Propioniciclava sp. MC1683]
MTDSRIARGTCAHLPGIDLCVMRVEPVGDEVWVQVLATYGSHQEVSTLRPHDPLDLPGGLRLTVESIDFPDTGEAIVQLVHTWTAAINRPSDKE